MRVIELNNMTHHPKVRDPQNPYRTGVLISNHVEDRFGQELAAQSREGRTGISEMQAKHTLNSSQFAVNAGKSIPTQQDILVSANVTVGRRTKNTRTTTKL